MRPTFKVGVLGLAATVAAAALAQAPARKAPAYHLQSETTVTGKVVSVTTVPDWMGKDGVNIGLQGAEVTAPHVDVATAAFLDMLDFSLVVGDDVTLTGCWSDGDNGQQVFLVHQIKKNRVMLNVRDPGGKPLW